MGDSRVLRPNLTQVGLHYLFRVIESFHCCCRPRQYYCLGCQCCVNAHRASETSLKQEYLVILIAGPTLRHSHNSGNPLYSHFPAQCNHDCSTRSLILSCLRGAHKAEMAIMYVAAFFFIFSGSSVCRASSWVQRQQYQHQHRGVTRVAGTDPGSRRTHVAGFLAGTGGSVKPQSSKRGG